MTLAIGARFSKGLIVCADSMVVASDGATSSDSKILATLSPRKGRTKRVCIVAEACEDVQAAKMLQQSISVAVSKTRLNRFEPDIRIVMEPWYNSYHHQKPPGLEFIVASIDVGSKQCWLHYCQPPHTVTFSIQVCPLVIGTGARAVESIVDIAWDEENKLDARAILLRLAYLMYLAKRDEASAVGKDTHAFVAFATGQVVMIGKKEMVEAEVLAKELDDRSLLTLDHALAGRSISNAFDDISKKYRDFVFPSLKMLDG